MADPVLWLKTDKPYEGRFRRARVWDEVTKQFVTPVYERGHAKAGRPVMERLPGVGFEGKDIHALRPMKGKRSIEVLRSDGHVVHVSITNAAAHQPQEDRSCESDRRLKARFFSWIVLGTCPAMSLAAGELQPENVATDARDVKKWSPCHPSDLGANKPPCPHFLAEMKARRAQRKDEAAATEKEYASEASKTTEALREMTTTVAEAVKAALLSGQATGGAQK
jgi:hypothetical protein